MFSWVRSLFASVKKPLARFSFWLHPEPEPLRVSDPVSIGIMAENLLRDPLLNATLAGIGERYRAELEAVEIGNIEALTLAHMKIHVLKDFLGQMQARIGNGKLEQSRLDAAKQREAAYQKALRGDAARVA